MGEAGVLTSRLTSSFPVSPTVEPGEVLENVRSALSRNLPTAQHCRAHGHTLCVAGGGPSLEDTWNQLDGYVVAVNGSHNWLLERDILPHACGLLDPGEHIADLIDPRDGVRYFVASTCHPAVFRKLEGYHVQLWHPSGTPGIEDILTEHYGQDWRAVGGGTTMGTRWINLGYFSGFRNFVLHGLDSSFSNGATHAYPDWRDGKEALKVDGFETSLNFLVQVQDFFATIERFKQNDIEPTYFEVKGEGLLQTKWREYTEPDPYTYWKSGRGMSHITPRGKDWPEGIEFPHYIKAKVGERALLDFGCGTGRFAGYFAPSQYTGYDICPQVLDLAVARHAEYEFTNLFPTKQFDVVLAHTVLLHVPDDDIDQTLDEFVAPTIMICEVMDRKWRHSGLPPVFNRNPEDYVNMLSNGYRLKNRIPIPYPYYGKEAELTFLEFECR